MKKIWLGLIGVVMAGVMLLPIGEKAYADCAGADTTILDCGDAQDGESSVNYILNLILSVLVYGIGVAGILGVTIAGIMYLTARDSSEQTAKAKKRLMEVAVGMIFFAVGGALLSWLVPGGLNLMPGGNSGGESNNVAGGNTGGENGGNGGNNGNGSTGGSGGAVPATNREQGSEEVGNENVGVGSGNEGWLEN